MIEISELVVDRDGTRVLDDVTAVVRKGSVTGLLGPSGSGKTTLLRAIVGVQRITGGSVRVAGLPAGHPELRALIGYQTQAPSVYADLTVAENLRYFASIARCDRRRVAAVLEDVRMSELAGQLVSRLSGGQRARVSLATAMIARPPLLVLDEPTVGLDPLLRRDLWRTFHRLAAEGTTLLVSSHVMDEARRCTDLLLLREGGLLAACTPAELGDDLEDAFCRLVEGVPA
ncbi:ABC transporter ATP-binding protein [Lentzea tibetensis]|nr:ABC transporter ATP-binding protein [Lentzea tibetensis]